MSAGCCKRPALRFFLIPDLFCNARFIVTPMNRHGCGAESTGCWGGASLGVYPLCFRRVRRRIARMRFAFCLRVRGLVSPPIGQTLSSDAAQGLVGAGFVIDAQR